MYHFFIHIFHELMKTPCVFEVDGSDIDRDLLVSSNGKLKTQTQSHICSYAPLSLWRIRYHPYANDHKE